MIINKVAGSGLVSLDLERYLPGGEIVPFDLKDYLFMGLILKEKDFRDALKNKDWEDFRNKNVSIVCTADAIIPIWAYMLIATYLQPVAKDIFVGTESEMYKYIFLRNIETIDANDFQDQRVVVKGCGDIAIDSYAYAAVTKKLLPVVKSVMYGEPCSTVPVFKKK
jgi:hypothetical protein